VENPAVHRLADWMAGGDAEQLLAARVPGLMPLREGVSLPLGVRSVRDIRSPTLDWEQLSKLDKTLTPQMRQISLP
jgi:hypothetical protein